MAATATASNHQQTGGDGMTEGGAQANTTATANGSRRRRVSIHLIGSLGSGQRSLPCLGGNQQAKKAENPGKRLGRLVQRSRHE